MAAARRLAVALFAILFILGIVTVPPEFISAQTGAFSRSDWIARNMTRVPFSGGVIPAIEPLAVPPTTSEPVPADSPPGFAPIRVNTDLLPPGPVAQPETQAEPYLAVNPANFQNLLAGYQEHRFSNGGARVLNYSVSFDAGRIWTEGMLPQLTHVTGGPWERASDPWVAYGPDNRAYFTSLLFNQSTPHNAIGVSVSTDGGVTWGPPVEVHRSLNNFNDKEAMTVDTHPSSPHLGNAYVAWDINVDRNGGVVAQHLVVARSVDGGETWEKPVKIRKKGTNIGALPRVGPDGTVYVVWSGGPLGGPVKKIRMSKSADGGRTWSKARVVSKMKPAGVPDIRDGAILVSFDVDRTSGDLYIGWQDRRWTGVDQATLIYSRDGGETWSAPRRISDGRDDAASFTVSVATARDGSVGISYYSLRNDPAVRFLVDKYLQVSHDRGETFSPGMLVTFSSFDVRFAAQANGFFLGDYVGLAGTDSKFHLLFVATIFNSALDPSRKNPDVFTAVTP